MMKSRFSEEQIIGILRERGGAERVNAVCARHNISEPPHYTWKRKYGGMDVKEARRLKRLVVDLSVQNLILKEVNAENGNPTSQRRAVRSVVAEGMGRAAVYRAVGKHCGENEAGSANLLETRHAGAQTAAADARLGLSTALWRRAIRIWSCDFVEDQTAVGSR